MNHRAVRCAYTPVVGTDDDFEREEVEPRDEPPFDDQAFHEEDEDVEEPPPSFRTSVVDAAVGLAALLAISVGVLLLYVAGGVVLGLLTWAAPAVLAVTAAILLARYLSKHR